MYFSICRHFTDDKTFATVSSASVAERSTLLQYSLVPFNGCSLMQSYGPARRGCRMKRDGAARLVHFAVT